MKFRLAYTKKKKKDGIVPHKRGMNRSLGRSQKGFLRNRNQPGPEKRAHEYKRETVSKGKNGIKAKRRHFTGTTN